METPKLVIIQNNPLKQLTLSYNLFFLHIVILPHIHNTFYSFNGKTDTSVGTLAQSSSQLGDEGEEQVHPYSPCPTPPTLHSHSQ